MKTNPGLGRNRCVGWLVAACVLSFALGCSVIEEVDKLGKDPKKSASKPAEGADADAPDGAEGGSKAKLRAYYKRKSKSVAEDPKNPIVSCQIAGTKTFMRLSDCELRGGKVPS